MANTLRVKYLGTNVGKIYLTDIGKRLGLGGGQEGDYNGGLDEYIIWGEVKVLPLTTDVLLSQTSGILKHFSTASNTDWSAKNGAPLILEEGAYTDRDEVPSKLFLTGTAGGTGLDYMWSDEYLSRLSDDKYAPTATSGATGYYYGNAL